MMSKPMGALFGVLTLVAILAIAPSAFAQQSQVTVNIAVGDGASPSCSQAKNCFNPDVVNVAPGTTVEWQNNDKVSHTVTSGNPSDNQTGTIFDSSLIAAGKSFSFTFNNPGTYNYFCQVHPWMTGQVIVGAATTASTTGNSMSGSSSSMNMSSGTTGNSMSGSSSSMNMSSPSTSNTPTTSAPSNTSQNTTTSSPSTSNTPTTSAPSNTSQNTTTSSPSTSYQPSTNTAPTTTESSPVPTSVQSSSSTTSSDQMTGWSVGMAVAAIMSGVGVWSAVRRR